MATKLRIENGKWKINVTVNRFRRAGCPHPAVCKFICNIYPVGEAIGLLRYGEMDAWATGTYGCACANRLHGGVRAEGELPEGQEKPLWSAPPYGNRCRCC